MIRIVIDDHVVGIPQPAIDVRKIPGGNAPVPVVETKTVRVAAAQSPPMFGSESTFKPAVPIRMIEVIMWIFAARVMAYPRSSVVNMGRIGMAWLVDIIAVFGT